MLSIQDIYALSQRHGLSFRAHYGNTSADDLQPPRPQSLTVWFPHVCAEAWEALMTNLTEVPVSIQGTRQSSPSGAIDGSLFPEYASRVKAVNEARASIGLQPVYG